MKLLLKRKMAFLLTILLLFNAVIVCYAADNSSIRSGNYAMQVECTSNAKWSGPVQKISVKKNTDYTLEVWSKGGGRFSVSIKNTSWTQIDSLPISPDSSWKKYTKTFNSGNNTVIIMQFIDSNVAGTAYIDDCRLFESGTTANLVKNGGFEGDVSFWDMSSVFEIIKRTTPVSNIPEQDIMIDKYGQFKQHSYDGKITSDAQLKATVAWDEEYYAGLTTPDNLDVYGGLKESKDKYGLTATGYFHTQQLSNGNWVMVDPLGNLFFSAGINGIAYEGDTYTKVKGREGIYEWIPEFSSNNAYYTAYYNGGSTNFSYYIANLIRKYEKPFNANEYARQQVERVKKWGFNTGGAWSSRVAEHGLPMFVVMDMPSYISGSRLYDVFASDWQTKVENAIKAKVQANVNNPLIMGYFIANELNFDKMLTAIPTAKASAVASKRKLVDMLKDKYSNNITSFNTAWNKNYASFDSIYEATNLTVSTNTAKSDYNEFMHEYFEQYYKSVYNAFKKFDNNHMLCGDRIMTSVTKDNMSIVDIVLQHAGKYNDVISYNNYRSTSDLNAITRMYNNASKPLMITEFSYSDTSTGLPPFGVAVSTPKEKGEAYRRYVEQHVATGKVVGTHWFEYHDQAPTGRYFDGFTGESYAFGLLDVLDRPYVDTVSEMKKANDGIYNLIEAKVMPGGITTNDPDNVHSGIGSIGVVGGSWSNKKITKPYTPVLNHKYKVSFYAKNTGPNTRAFIKLEAKYTANDNSTKTNESIGQITFESNLFDKTNEWQLFQYELTLTAPADMKSGTQFQQSSISIQNSDDRGADIIYIDDLTVVDVTANDGVDLLNGAGTFETSPADAWSNWSASNANYITYFPYNVRELPEEPDVADAFNVHSGNRSMGIRCTENSAYAYKTISKSADVIFGHTYRVDFYAKPIAETTDNSITAYVRLEYSYNDGSKTVKVNDKQIKLDKNSFVEKELNKWKKFSFNVEMPYSQGNSALTAKLVLGNGGQTNGDIVYIDDITVVDITEGEDSSIDLLSGYGTFETDGLGAGWKDWNQSYGSSKQCFLITHLEDFADSVPVYTFENNSLVVTRTVKNHNAEPSKDFMGSPLNNIKHYIAVYDKDKLVATGTSKVANINSGFSNDLTAKVSFVDIENGKYLVKSFVWDSTNLKPVFALKDFELSVEHN